jgi:hypothetical protein
MDTIEKSKIYSEKMGRRNRNDRYSQNNFANHGCLVAANNALNRRVPMQAGYPDFPYEAPEFSGDRR